MPASPAEVRVSVNRGSVEQLSAVKGLGAAVARAIVAGRPHAQLDDLLAVRGIGPKLLERFRPFLTL
uniref:ComEA family DNA-binding protein n=1 Tax=Sphaerotilus hippei TaxID=744406 RepID=UPI0035BF8D65